MERSKYRRTLLVKDNKPTRFYWLLNKLESKYNKFTKINRKDNKYEKY